MVNTYESAIKIVSYDKRKWLLRLNQNGKEVGTASLNYAFVTHTPPGREQAPNPTYCASGTWQPRIAPSGDSKPQGLPMAVREQDIGRSECRAVTARIRVLMLPDAKAGLRPIGGTSRERWQNR